jgi:4-hydroxy-tetrahydrodipicolinate reductase
MSLRVVQWTTGNVGRRAARAVLRHPELHLVGVFAYGPDKVGRDAGELCGVGPIGITATDDVEALLAAAPDCVTYNPMFASIDELERLLESGVNVVSTAGFITGRAYGTEATERLADAARRGHATLHGTGINPGHANAFALASAAICDRVDRISVLESADASGYASPDTQRSVGFATPIDAPDLAARAEHGTEVFGDAVAMMADALGIDLEQIGSEFEFARATADNDLGFMVIPEGTVAGVRGCWFGMARERRVIELRFEWKMGTHLEPDWKLRHGYFIEIDGEPRVRSQLQLLPPPDWDEPDFMGLGMIMTAMPAVNAIPAVCAAPPGLVTAAQLPLVTARGFVAP